MKLWLDDTRPAPEGWLWVRSVEEAIYVMGYRRRTADSDTYEYPYRENFEACSLDRDLGQGDDMEGIKFIDWMIENNIWPKEKPKVHSMNPIGAARMRLAINRYYPEGK